MKRSEMILNIQTEIAPLFNITDSYTSYQYAENILKMIEENGMMPPQVDNLSYRTLPSGEMTYAVHQWEAE